MSEIKLYDYMNTFENPTEKEIKILLNLNKSLKTKRFMTLCKDDDMEYIQCAYSTIRKTWHLEKNEKISGKLITYRKESLRDEEILEIFINYINGVSWEKLCNWEDPVPLRFSFPNRIYNNACDTFDKLVEKISI